MDAKQSKGGDSMQEMRTLSDEDLGRVISMVRDGGYKLLGWWVLGQPRPDWFQGVVRTGVDEAPSVIKDLISLERVRVRLDVFPYGIPIPDEVLIRFSSRGLPQDPVPL